MTELSIKEDERGFVYAKERRVYVARAEGGFGMEFYDANPEKRDAYSFQHHHRAAAYSYDEMNKLALDWVNGV